jgi:NTP pyrophosphatase (non-canonical NTP hydrolase)
MKNTPEELAAQIMQHYGAEAQKDILIEECAELIQAVEKSRRIEDKPAYTYDMISEMADVQIMLWQFESVMTAYARQCFEDEVYRKLRRQIERIEEERR